MLARLRRRLRRREGAGKPRRAPAAAPLTNRDRRRLLGELRSAFPAVEAIVCRVGDARYAVHPGDGAIGFGFLTGAGFERDVFDRALEVVERRRLRPRVEGRLFVDVGANIGFMTVYARRSGWFPRALCFEPEPANVRLLETNLALNGLAPSCRVVPCAIGDREGSVRMELAPRNLGDHRVRVEPRDREDAETTAPSRFADGEPREVSEPVAMTTLDAALAAHGVPPRDVGCVWVDTQGFEGFVLAGARGLLGGSAPVTVTELWPYGLRRSRSWPAYREAVGEFYAGFADLAQDRPELLPVDALERRFEELAAADDYTDVLLVPKAFA
jgi:FkbM family methyltransferase